MQVPGLLQEYKGCLATRKLDEAEKINKEINYFITNEINTTGWELFCFADDLQIGARRFEESVPVYFAAASLLKKEGNLVEMGWCVGDMSLDHDGWGGMRRANEKMIERDVTMKEVVKHHVIPLMRDIKNQMLEVTSVSEEEKCRGMSRVLRYIAMSEELVGDDVAAEQECGRKGGWSWRRKVNRRRWSRNLKLT